MILSFCEVIEKEGIEGYDPSGAWPILIDDFVEYFTSQNR